MARWLLKRPSSTHRRSSRTRRKPPSGSSSRGEVERPEGARIVGEFDLIAGLPRPVGRRTGVRSSWASATTAPRLRFTPGFEVLVTTDMLMDGRHFRLGEASPEEVGYKAMAVNLSDIAAMAGTPVAAVVAVALPRNTAAEIAPRLHAGLLDAARAVRRRDRRRRHERLGRPSGRERHAPRRGRSRENRSAAPGARAGDAIFVTGPLGGSLLGRHLRPVPRIERSRLRSPTSRRSTP